MPKKDIVVIGASAGGIEALRKLAAALPPDFPAAVFVVVHVAPDAPSMLPQILSHAGYLTAEAARDDEPVEPGRVYVAPPDHHLLLDTEGRVRLSRGPKENRFRPAVDPLFRSAARAYGPRVIGVVLSGGLDDGTVGLLAIKRRGGTAVVQDPADALIPSMPLSALAHVKVDHTLPLAGIGPLLVRLATEPAADEGEHPVSNQLETEVKIAMEDNAVEVGVMELGEASPYTCADCHGTLLRMKGEGPVRFRCHTGHAFTADSLLSGMTLNIEDSLWSTIRALEEAEMLLRHMGQHLSAGARPESLAELSARADELHRRADLVRQAAMTSGTSVATGD